MRREHATEYIRPPLPSEYREVNYISSYNSNPYYEPYINTNYYASEITRIDIKVYVGAGGWIFGGRTSLAVGDALGFFYDSGQSPINCWPQFGNTSGTEYLAASFSYNIHEIVMDKTGAYIDGSKLQNTIFNDNVWTGVYPIWLFNLNNAGSTNSGFWNGRFYYFKAYNDNTIKRDMVPVLRIADSKPGMWDYCQSICPLTNSPFYVKAGGIGEFNWA